MSSCNTLDDFQNDGAFPKLMELPKGFPPIEEPEGNEFTLERWQLGKKLFYDPILSRDSSISCGSCHAPDLAFTDALSTSEGIEGRIGDRNASTLANVGYHPYILREGGVPTLEFQVLVPIQEAHEFDFNIVLIAEKLAKDSNYVQLARSAYGRMPDPFVITRSIACFERSLISGNSAFDKMYYQERDNALTNEALNGWLLFNSSRTNCSSCHSGFNFTDYSFQNNGLYADYPDPGRMRVTGDSNDLALFKVPSLRNISVTKPYMHDGSLASLEEVVEHYNSGGFAHNHKSAFIQPLHLSEVEKQELVAFLESLTDYTFLQNPLFER